MLAAAAGTTLGGISFVGTRYLIGQVDPVTLAALRYAMAALCLLPFALLSPAARHVRRGDRLGVAGLGLMFFCLHPLFFTVALQYTTAAYGGLMMSLAPMLTLLLSALRGYERITARKAIGVCLVVAGVAGAVGESAFGGIAGPQAWLGNLIMLGTALLAALYNVLSRPLLQRNPATPVIAYGMAAGAAGLVLLMLLLPGTAPAAVLRFDATGWLVLAGLGTFCAAGTFWLFVWAMKHAAPTRVAVFLGLNPVVAMLLGAAVLDERVTLLQVAGLVLVLAGIVVVNRPGKAA